jgi:hypothetical protein
LNQEPYFMGWDWWENSPNGERPVANSPRDNYFSRAHAYGSVLSGGLAGHTFGSAAYDGDTTGEPRTGGPENPSIWEALVYEAEGQMQYVKDFLLSEGRRYQDLELASDDLEPRFSPGSSRGGLDGWAFQMRTPDRSLALLYFESACQRVAVKGLAANARYRAQWFDPRAGRWSDCGSGILASDAQGRLALPDYPGGAAVAPADWALKLKLER